MHDSLLLVYYFFIIIIIIIIIIIFIIIKFNYSFDEMFTSARTLLYSPPQDA